MTLILQLAGNWSKRPWFSSTKIENFFWVCQLWENSETTWPWLTNLGCTWQWCDWHIERFPMSSLEHARSMHLCLRCSSHHNDLKHGIPWKLGANLLTSLDNFILFLVILDGLPQAAGQFQLPDGVWRIETWSFWNTKCGALSKTAWFSRRMEWMHSILQTKCVWVVSYAAFWVHHAFFILFLWGSGFHKGPQKGKGQLSGMDQASTLWMSNTSSLWQEMLDWWAGLWCEIQRAWIAICS